MRNRDVAEMLDRAARILALRGENRYRVRAYQKAARAVASLSEDIEVVVGENRLQSINGIGAALAEKIREIVKTGKLAMLERIETAELPEDQTGRFVLLASALTFSKELLPALTDLPGVTAVQVTGETRRRCETVSSLDFILATTEVALTKKALHEHKQLHHLKWQDDTCFAVHSFGIPLILHLTREDHFMYTLWLTTGVPGHVKAVADIVSQKAGLNLLNSQEKSRRTFLSEKEIYTLADLPFIQPEMREDRGEIQAAYDGKLPQLVDAADYKGDLHVHTDWSDGTASVEKMVEAAGELGYEYVAITDHSRSLKIARGLTLERLNEQKSFIASLQDKYKIRVLTGIEADILDDGSVDAPDDVLAGLDVVVASVHSGFKQDKVKLTARICRAMQNPYVQMIGHATGRLLGKREPYAVDMDEVLKTAQATGTILEINSSPDRLDITDLVSRQAKEAGIGIAINTDAHSQLELANVLLGLSVARRGWLSRSDVINTRGSKDVLEVLHNKKNRR